jgi:hypothetical protein
MRRKIPRVPQHSSELVAARAAKWFGDDEKVATTSLKGLVVEGVSLISRYDKARELELMAIMVTGLPFDLAKRIKSIFCDSKCGVCFTVTLKHWPAPSILYAIGDRLDQLLCKHNDGHNGLDLRYGDKQHEVNPNWLEDDEI